MGSSTVSPLAEATYTILRQRLRLAPADPRITYAEVAKQLCDSCEDFEAVNHRSRSLYAALGEVGGTCRLLGRPPVPALVVLADRGRPGRAYSAGRLPRVESQAIHV